MKTKASLVAAILLVGSLMIAGWELVSHATDYSTDSPMLQDFSSMRVEFLTYLGGNMEDWLRDVIFDDAGNVWVLGYTESTDIPLHNPIQETYGGQGDALIARFSPQHELEFCTYFGGIGTDYAMAFTLDNDGNIIVAGSTQSSDFYTLNALQTDLNGTSDVFVTKISPSGTVLFSTYYGGSGEDSIEDIEIDSSGNLVMVGDTSSDDLETNASVVQSTYGGGTSDILLLSIASDGQSILFSSYFGGNAQDLATALQFDDEGNIGIVGFTGNNDTVTPEVFQVEYGGGQSDAIIAKITPNCESILWSTLLGGDGWEFGSGIRFDSQNNVIVSGYTGSTDFPLQNPSYGNDDDYEAFLTRLNEDGSSLFYSTYIGGDGEDRSYGLDLLSDDSAVVLCNAGSGDMPAQPPLIGNYSGMTDAYLTVFSNDMLSYAVYIGGSYSDYATGLSVWNDEIIAFTGYTYSEDLPVVNPSQTDKGGSSDGYLCILNMTEELPTSTTTTTTETTDVDGIDPILMAMVGAGAVAIVIILVVIQKKR